MEYCPEWYRKQKYRQIPIHVQKHEIRIIDTQMVSKKDGTSATLVATY
jgi:hypothetical protein